MDNARTAATLAALLLSAPALAAEPQAAPPAEAPYVGETMELNAEQRQEKAFRAIQQGLERQRSEKSEDQELIVCLKQKPTGSNVTVINCATNRFWRKIRDSSLSSTLGSGSQAPGGYGAGTGGGGSARKEDKVVTLSLTDFHKLEKRFGKLPKTDASKP